MKSKNSEKITKVPRTVNFDSDIIERLSAVKGRLSRSKYVNIALEEIISRDEDKLGIS